MARSAARGGTLPRLWMFWLTRCCDSITGGLPLAANSEHAPVRRDSSMIVSGSMS
jgi:hypothetical protein